MIFKKEIKDLLLVGNKYVICHCISSDCAMGAGVVIPIKRKYKGLKDACINYTENIDSSNIVGTAFRYETNEGVVYNLFSKEDYRQRAGYGISEKQYLIQLESSLKDMKNQMKIHNEKYLAMPKIASGIDNCKWENVEKLIKEVFNDTDVEILVCSLE